MKINVRVLIAVFMLVSIISLVSCGKDPATSSTTSTPAPAVCNQSCQDNYISSAVISLVTFLYNQNFAGETVGTKNKTVNCPHGGSVHITGTTAIDTSSNINTLHLTYDMTSCQYQASNYNLVFTGSIKEDGTFESLPGTFIAMTYSTSTGSLVNYSGSVSSAAPTQVSGDCAVTLSRSKAGSASERINGTICGRTVSY